MVGQHLGHFHLVEKIGHGGMGDVYRAHDEQLERDVAIKVLPAISFSDATARMRLLREARTASKLNHPHICTIHEVGEEESQAYIAMEFVEGQSLAARLAGGPLPIEEVLRYAVQLADALGHAHRRGIVHRDLKSANIMLTPEARAKVLDFGLARHMRTDVPADAATQTQETLTERGKVAGTLAYMAPEQLRGRPADARSDLWALGVVLYEMVAGVRPFQGETHFELSSAILTATPGPLPASVPAALRAIIGRCLAKAPEERYQRAEDVRAALEASRSGGHVRAPLFTRRRLVLAAGLSVLALLFVLGTGLWRVLRGPRLNSIVVLPLKNLSGDPQQEYFSDGMTEALITDLAKIRALKVISRTSAMRYKGTDKPLRAIAAELKVDAVVEGSALRVGDRVRITAQLIEARTEQNLWAESYERNLRDILSLQGEVARAIAHEIKVAVTPEETKRLARARPVNPEAYAAYLQGLFHLYKPSPRELETALAYFQLALDKDPSYALAYAGISLAWATRAQMGFLPSREGYGRAKAAAAKAIALDDTLAEAHQSLATVLRLYDWDWPAAEREFKRAIDLNPNSAFARAAYSLFLTSMRRSQEARAQIERALELDPHNHFFQSLLGGQLLWWRQYDDAVAQLRNALRNEPDNLNTHELLAQALHVRGMYEEHLAETKKVYGLLGDDEVLKAVDHGYAEGGYRRAMRMAAQVLAARSRRTYVNPMDVASHYAYAGEKGLVLEWLEKAYEERAGALILINMDPTFDPLRSDPRFQDLLRRMKFPAN